MESRDRSEAASRTCQSNTIDYKEGINLVDETQADGKIEGDEETMTAQREHMRTVIARWWTLLDHAPH